MKRYIKVKIGTFVRAIRRLPEHKTHIDFFVAILTIPMMVTVIVINILNLQNKSQSPKNPGSPTPIVVQVKQDSADMPQTKTTALQASLTPTASVANVSCKPDIGPIDISFPQEGQTVSANPVCISINYQGDGYCSVAWAYKINNGDWSDYTNTSACLYNLPQGDNTFTLQVKSTVTNKTQTILRHFIYASSALTTTLTPTTTITPTAAPTQ